MTDENRFFRYVWRFNAVVLACVAMVVGGAMFYTTLFPWRSVEIAPAGHFAPVPQNAEKEFTYRLQSGGERYVVGREKLIALGRWNGSPESYSLAHASSGRYEETRSPNILAVDQVTVESHWIFKGYNRNITADDLVYESVPSPVPPTPDQVASPAVALVMTVIDADTNKDGELTEKDRKSLYVYRAGAIEAARLLTADLIVSRQQIGRDRYLVIYENGTSAVAATFSLPEFKLVAEKPLPKVPNG